MLYVVGLSLLASYSEIITLTIVYSAVQHLAGSKTLGSKQAFAGFVSEFILNSPYYVTLFVFALVFLFSTLIRFSVLKRQAILSAKFGALVGVSLFARLVSMELSDFKRLNTSVFNTIITKDADLIVYGFQGLVSIASNSILVLSISAFLILISPTTTSIVLFVVPALFFVAFVPARAKVVRLSRLLTKNHSAFLQSIQWVFYDFFSIKIDDKPSSLIRKFRRVYFLRRKAEQLVGLYQQLPRLLIESGLFFLIVLLLVLFRDNPRLISGFIITLFGSFRLLSPLNQLFVSYTNVEACRHSLGSYLEVTSNIALRDIADTAFSPHCDSCKFPAGLVSIALTDVTYSYPGSPFFMTAKDLALNSGDSLLIYGPSGSGKTTLLNIIAGLVPPDHGSVIINGLPLTTTQLRLFWKDRLAYVPQEVLLYGSTISSYLNCLSLDINSIHLRKVLDAVLLLADFDSQKLRLDSSLGERGSLLSGGQRQRLSVAKSLLKSPQLLVLDEPTSALDPVTSSLLISSIQRVYTDIVIIVVSHDHQLLRFFKRHWKFESTGRVVDVSTV